MIFTLRSIVTALQSMTETLRMCDNPECGELITFYANEPRPIVCARWRAETFNGKRNPMSVESCPVFSM